MIGKLTARKYQLPNTLAGVISQNVYERWLARKAATHVKRDRRRKNRSASIESYKIAIHKAVKNSGGIDSYTGEKLRWDLISKFNNEAAKLGRRRYKASMALLPTVDHVGDGTGAPNFNICSWRTNGAKGDLRYSEFVKLCHRVVQHRSRAKR
jgi:hypothetical protein